MGGGLFQPGHLIVVLIIALIAMAGRRDNTTVVK